jgi:hypothetical protein
MTRATERCVSDFKSAEANPNAAVRLIDDIQTDRNQFKKSDSEGWRNELNRINTQLHNSDALPKVELTNGKEQEMKILMLTSEKGLSHGVVLSAGQGENKKVVVLNEDGKYVEAQQTANGYIEKRGGKEYEKDEDGVLQLRRKHKAKDDSAEEPKAKDKDKDKSDATPEVRMTPEENTNAAVKLWHLLNDGNDAEASQYLRLIDRVSHADARDVANRLKELNEKASAEEGGFLWGARRLLGKKDFAPIQIGYEKDPNTGEEYPVSVRRAKEGDVTRSL